MSEFLFWLPVMAGGTVAGASSGLLGAFIVGMRIPFLGVCVAHAALAGAVFGSLMGFDGQALLVPALAGALVAALALGVVDPHQFHLGDNTTLGFLFSLTMGLAFLGIGLHGIWGRSDSAVRSMMWGSLNFCRWADVRVMLAGGGFLAAYVLVFFKELRAIMFSRDAAKASGVRTEIIWPAFLVAAALVLTVNFQSVGGLMIYSLICNPAAAAIQLAKGFRKVIVLSSLLGALSGLGGFLISWWTDLPTGAVIVLFSSLVLAIASLCRRLARPL